MPLQPEIPTHRLRLRRWMPSDREAFSAYNADSRVAEFLPGVLTREQSDAFIERIEAHFERYGFGLWALEILDSGMFAGYVGLSVPRFTAHFTPCVEIGWRLGFEHWGKGYATEAARAVLEFAFKTLDLKEIVSFTVPQNMRSLRVMERIGMTHDPADDFDHPNLPEGHPLRRHVLYRIGK